MILSQQLHFGIVSPEISVGTRSPFPAVMGSPPPLPEESGHPAREDPLPFPSQILTVHVQLFSFGGLV